MDGLDSGDDRLRLDDQLCFALYAATNAITRRYRPLLGELGLTYPQYLVMIALWQRGATPVGEIAAHLELDSHAVSPLVDRLESSGLVRRRPGRDRRQVVVEPTDRGRDLEAAAARVQSQVACDTGLTTWELADLRRALRDLSAELAAAPDPRLRPSPQPAARAGNAEGDVS